MAALPPDQWKTMETVPDVLIKGKINRRNNDQDPQWDPVRAPWQSTERGRRSHFSLTTYQIPDAVIWPNKIPWCSLFPRRKKCSVSREMFFEGLKLDKRLDMECKRGYCVHVWFKDGRLRNYINIKYYFSYLKLMDFIASISVLKASPLRIFFPVCKGM